MADAWDVFHSENLSVDRAVPDSTVRARLRDGTLTPDDLVRPAGTTRWSRIEQVPDLVASDPPAPEPPPLSLRPLIPEPDPEPTPARTEEEYHNEGSTVVLPTIPPPEPLGPTPPGSPSGSIEAVPLFVPLPPAPEPEPEPEPRPESSESIEAAPVFMPPPPPSPIARPSRPEPAPPPVFEPNPGGSAVAASPIFEPILLPDDEDAEGPPAHPDELGDPEPVELEGANWGEDEDEEAASFTLSRGQTERVEELDLAAMVDVAFQLVLFFLVTASTVVFKTLEIPKPSEDKPPEVAAQSRAKTLDELEKDFILLEIDAEGHFKVDHLPVASDRAALTEKLRQAREGTDRRALLLATDPATRHRVAVLASDIAREINLEVSWAKAAPP